MPESHNDRRTGGVRRHVVTALKRPARRPKCEAEIQSEHPRKRYLHDRVV